MRKISDCYKFLLREDAIDKYDVFINKAAILLEGKVS